MDVNGLDFWWKRAKELEKEIKFALKFMEAQGYQNYSDHEPEFQMWRSLKNMINPNGEDA